MRLTLSDKEIRIVLAEAIEKKLNHQICDIDIEECWFCVSSPDGQVEDIEEVTFSFNADNILRSNSP